MPITTVEQRIDRAKDFFARYGRELMPEKIFQELMADYRAAIENTWRLMSDYGVIACCGACAARDPAGCCGNGVEEWYDEWLLIENLMLGCTIDGPRSMREGCLFVGPQGCGLLARHQFCVNFLCSAIVDSIDPARIQELLSVSGAELFAGWQLEQQLRGWIRSHDGALEFCRREGLL